MSERLRYHYGEKYGGFVNNDFVNTIKSELKGWKDDIKTMSENEKSWTAG